MALMSYSEYMDLPYVYDPNLPVEGSTNIRELSRSAFWDDVKHWRKSKMKAALGVINNLLYRGLSVCGGFKRITTGRLCGTLRINDARVAQMVKGRFRPFQASLTGTVNYLQRWWSHENDSKYSGLSKRSVFNLIKELKGLGFLDYQSKVCQEGEHYNTRQYTHIEWGALLTLAEVLEEAVIHGKEWWRRDTGEVGRKDRAVFAKSMPKHGGVLTKLVANASIGAYRAVFRRKYELSEECGSVPTLADVVRRRRSQTDSSAASPEKRQAKTALGNDSKSRGSMGNSRRGVIIGVGDDPDSQGRFATPPKPGEMISFPAHGENPGQSPLDRYLEGVTPTEPDADNWKVLGEDPAPIINPGDPDPWESYAGPVPPWDLQLAGFKVPPTWEELQFFMENTYNADELDAMFNLRRGTREDYYGPTCNDDLDVPF